MTNTKNNNNTKLIRYFGELQRLPSGEFKVAHMEKLVGINQHKRKWVGVNSRNFARELNNSTLVIK